MCPNLPSLIQIGSKTADKNSAQTNRQTDRQTDRYYENNGHLAVNQELFHDSPDVCIQCQLLLSEQKRMNDSCTY